MPGRILIADDLATNRIVMQVKLSAASYGVIHAANRNELMKRARTTTPDLILLNGNFQNGRSIDICLELKANAKTAEIPLMILENDFTPVERLAALHAGANEVLARPVDDDILLARIRNSMRVRGIEEELRLRADTALELGFREPVAEFKKLPQLLVIKGTQPLDTAWVQAFQNNIASKLHQLDNTSVLDAIVNQNLTPDIIVMPARLDPVTTSLFLLAALRNCENTRRATIVVVDDGKRDSAAITALDMGANEVISAQAPPAEFAFRLAQLLGRKQKADQLRDTLEEGLRLAVTDPLTGLFNRRYAFPHMARIVQSATLSASPYAVMVLDLDRFKRINDTYGHTAGDKVLKEVANRLRDNVRGVDLVARIGGEEFLVVMPDTGLNAARIAAERLRQVTEFTPISIKNAKGRIHVTTSIGVSIGGGHDRVETTVEAMVDRADQALLSAKSTGRNQVIFEKSAACATSTDRDQSDVATFPVDPRIQLVPQAPCFPNSKSTARGQCPGVGSDDVVVR